MIAQIRTSGLDTFKMKVKISLHIKNTNELRQVSNMKVTENLFHIMTQYPGYKDQRTLLLPLQPVYSDFSDDTNVFFHLIFNYKRQTNNTFILFINALKIRPFFLYD